MTADKDVAIETVDVALPSGPAAPCPAQSPSRPELLRLLFRSLDRQGIRYCVLHSYQDLPESVHGDLDLAVHPEDLSSIAHVFESLRSQGYRPVQFLNYAVRGFYFVFFWFEEQHLQSLAIDVIVEHRRNGLIFASGEHLVSRRRRRDDFWIPDPADEFAYLLSKKSLKGIVPAYQEQRLSQLVTELGPARAIQIAAGLVGKRHAGHLVQACTDGSLAGFIGIWKRRIWLTALKKNPFTPARYFSADLFRIVRRWFAPTGLFLAVLGPDGTGKSTLIGQLLDLVGPAFRRQRVFHWRPGFLARKKFSSPVTNPHGQVPRSAWVSTLHLSGRLLDYWLGYCFAVRPLLARSGLVIFDRYFYDLFADPIRYRYAGPQWFVRTLAHFVPRPDLLMILDAPEHVVRSRKQEVPSAEITRQREAYRGAFSDSARVLFLDASRRKEELSEHAARRIATFLEERFRRRHPFWLSEASRARTRGCLAQGPPGNDVQRAVRLLWGLSPNYSSDVRTTSAPSLTSRESLGYSHARPQFLCEAPLHTPPLARQFAVLPSLRSPRWLLPLDHTPCALRGLDIWVPHSRLGRLAKRLVRLSIQSGLLGLVADRAILRSCGLLPIAKLITEVTGEPDVFLSLSLGTRGPFRKLTLRVMHRSGECLGYIKLPLMAAADTCVRHEAETLSQLWTFASLRPFIPRVLYAGPWGDSFLLFQSPGPAGRAPAKLGPLHHEFLSHLWAARPSKKSGCELALEVAARWRECASCLDGGWQLLAERALQQAATTLAGCTVPCGLSHGDFAPWNTRSGNGRLFVFDWESAKWDAPLLWDVLHFHVQVGALLNKRGGRGLHINLQTSERAAFILYLINSVCEHIQQETSEAETSASYRLKLLSHELSDG